MGFEGYQSYDKWGGETTFGIAERYFPDIVKKIKEAKTQEEKIQIAKDFYKKVFWDALNCDKHPYPLDIIIFDSAVNPFGVPRMLKVLNEVFSISSDTKIQCCLILLYRAIHYTKVCEENKEKKQYLFGWMRRVKKLFELVKA